MPHRLFTLFCPLDLADVRITLSDSCLKVSFCFIVINLILEIIAERILDQLNAALVISGKGCDGNILCNRSKVFEWVLSAKECG